MRISELIKNPLVFGCVVGILLCAVLFIYDKYLSKKPEETSGFSTYFKLFLAGFIVSAPLVFLVFNRNLSFDNTEVIAPVVSQNVEVAAPILSGGNIEDIIANADKELISAVLPDDASSVAQSFASTSLSKRPKKVYTNLPYTK